MDVIISHRFYLQESQPLNTTAAPPPPLHSSFPIIAVAVIGILATAFLLVSYYVFVIKCCLSWHRIDLLRRFSSSARRRRVDDTRPTAAVEGRGLDEAAIRSIPIFRFRKCVGRSWECAVCLSEFQEEEKLRIIPNCAHVFHIDCIDIWLQNNANCPLCRASISPHIEEQILAPSPAHQDSNSHCYDGSFIGGDEDYVVIELGLDSNPSLPRILENLSSDELLSISPSPRKIRRKKGKRFSSVLSMGDECIDNRKKDEQFVVDQPMRRSFSMDSAADNQLYLAVQQIIQGQVSNEASSHEDCSSSCSSRVKRSFFSFGQGRGSRTVQPVALEL